MYNQEMNIGGKHLYFDKWMIQKLYCIYRYNRKRNLTNKVLKLTLNKIPIPRFINGFVKSITLSLA